MADAVVYRYDAPNTEQPHGVFSKTVAGVANSKIVKQAIDGESVNFGAAATGNILNAAGGSGVALGSFVSCDGKSLFYFSLAFSAVTGTRQFRIVYKDFNATSGYVIGPDVLSRSSLGLYSGSTPALAALATSYYHAEGIIVPCLGMKEITLLIADDATVPLVHAWGAGS